MTRGKRIERTILDRDLPLLVVVPLLDAIAILGAVWLWQRAEALGLIFAASTLMLLAAARTRPTRLTLSLGDEVAGIVARIALATFALTPFTVGHTGLVDHLRTGAFAIAFVLAGRAISYPLIRTLRRRGLGLEPALIVGAGDVGVTLANALLLHPEHGVSPIGFVDSTEGVDLPLPIVGTPGDIATLVTRHGARRVIIAFLNGPDEELVRFVRGCDTLYADIHVVPRFFELGVGVEQTSDDISGIPISLLRRAPHRSLTWPVKRAFDIVVASLALVATSPVMAFAALAVRLSSPGPILFRQRRLGQGMKTIEVMKFRTMRVNEDSDTTWSVLRDERLTPIGRVLRQTHLDELPQLINVLRGDMSLVGPRPERPYFAELFSAEIPGYGDRHRVPVGITGWAQVHGLNGDTSIEERVRFDNRYIESWSLWRDLVILARTGAAVLTGLRLDEGEPVGTEPTPEAAPDVIDLRLVEVDLRAIENENGGESKVDVESGGTPSASENGTGTAGNGRHKNGNGRARRSTDGPARQS
jgi:exopolysaccharide biosynthesis polyprenyl glycosylphosphotransferase